MSRKASKRDFSKKASKVSRKNYATVMRALPHMIGAVATIDIIIVVLLIGILIKK